MSMYVIKGARILGAAASDVVVEDGVIAEIGPAGATSRAGAEVVDADGLVALPGLVDLHTHLREPGREDAETVETGTAAAALGGWGARPGTATYARSVRSRSDLPAGSSRSSVRWPTVLRESGCSPTTATASRTRC